MTASPLILLSKGRMGQGSGVQLFLGVEGNSCHLRGLLDGSLVLELEVPWDQASWTTVTIPAHGEIPIFVDTRPWRPASSIDCPTETFSTWLWISYCGWHQDSWYDGPLGVFKDDRVASYLPPLGTSCLKAAEVVATRSWSDAKAATLPICHSLHSASLALADRWPVAPYVYADQLKLVDALHLVCLARAFSECRLSVWLREASPEARKFLLHIGAKLVTTSQSEQSNPIQLAELAKLLSPFSTDLVKDVSRLSAIVPELFYGVTNLANITTDKS